MGLDQETGPATHRSNHLEPDLPPNSGILRGLTKEHL